MPEASFKTTFTWDSKKKASEKWTWHDKTPFPWDRVIKAGVSDGPRNASAADVMNAAERIAQSLKLKGAEIHKDRAAGKIDQQVPAQAGVILEKIARAIGELLK
eukprot:gnl/Spiro4/8261_TR4368_c0_g2_i1.p2 gnl/Spiro4/8261_TR4368_c0_g2~~gnl/Spiro4/8261_TR4368_c0_g2_i1.p2  ORF type:complete len:104 (-),score=14.51 gnl/Spiro4/8261_TR4368_c0_g2_i1:166-477(-)